MDENRGHNISSVTAWGAAANLGLSAFKLIAGLVGCSSAMIADAVHSLSDLISDLVVLVMVRISSKGKDKGHDYGHGKFETLATVILSLLLLGVGVKLMISAVSRIIDVFNGLPISSPGLIALIAAIVSIAVKEILYQWTAREGRKLNSPVMIANAWHHRSDALSSVGSALGIGGALFIGGKWTVLDPAVGAIISIVIVVVAIRMMIPALGELTEASLPEETEDRISSIIGSVDGVYDVHALKTRRSGPDIIIDVHIRVDAGMSVATAHELTEKAESDIRKEFGEDTQISIHVEPLYQK